MANPEVLILGSGAAGLTLALRLAQAGRRVTVVSKTRLESGSTLWAQGGISAVLDEGDSLEAHVRDTLVAGGGLCDEKAVRFTVDGGPRAIRWLVDLGVEFTRDDDDPQRFKWTCTVLTTTAEDAVGHIHDRMPLLVEPDRYAAWLDPTLSEPDELRKLLVPAAPGRLEAYPVSTQVNSVRNNGPELLEPLAAEPEGLVP